MPFPTLQIPEFLTLKREIETYPRMHGEYLIDLVSIAHLRAGGLNENDILDEVYCHWSGVASVEDLLYRGEGDGYEVSTQHLLETLVDGLKGGAAVGHTIDSMPEQEALRFSQRFLDLFEQPRGYMGMGITDRCIFEHGLLLMDQNHAGLLLVLEDD
ncbi:hypothetical protein [Deinococcus roseus]|uniref:Uncharacterized protein n=1 Tax=Deinococcus roseus TaxID=392414 RepID=A0ABQ2D010_9DEIO|nr:hypothetical protein [Deinococcus roseus]GGJ37567.1 hypothetical protein GCM10008938_24640 [Deinococcus roseus]